MLPRFARALLVATFFAGCSEPPRAVESASSAEEQNAGERAPSVAAQAEKGVLREESLNASVLADILGVQAWRFSYQDGPVECWLKIEEAGQKTMQKRIPKDTTMESLDADGEILLSIRSLQEGGEILLRCGERESRYGLTNEQFTFHWRHGAESTSHTPIGTERLIQLSDGKEHTLVTYTARENAVTKEAEPRQVTMTLVARLRDSPTLHQ